MKIYIPKELKVLSKKFPKQNHLYIVGGYIRDCILKINSKDIDLASSLTIDNLEKVLEGTSFILKNKNKKCGTAQIFSTYNLNIKFDYSTFRKEIYDNKGSHSPSKVEFITTVDEDSFRRDFTINCIYYDIKSKKIFDHFGGVKDIKNKLLREICFDTLNFDGERILRLIKLSAKLGFEIEEKTFMHALENKNNILSLNDTTLQKFKEEINSLKKEQIEKVKSLLIVFGHKNLLEK